MVYPITIQPCFITVHTDESCDTLEENQYDYNCDIWSNCKSQEHCDLKNVTECDKKTCIEAFGYGDSCNPKLDKCLPGLYCKNDTCQYYQYKLLGSTCTYDNDCIGKTTVCLAGTCQNQLNKCNVSLDCQFGEYCANIVNGTGQCAAKITSGKCTDDDQCAYPKVCGYDNDNLDSLFCVDRFSAGNKDRCTTLFECSSDFVCQNGTCQTLVLSTKECDNSCACAPDELCGFDLTRDKQVCWTQEQLLNRKLCVQCNNELVKCAQKHMCPYENDLIITMNECINQYCLEDYKRYTDQCYAYASGSIVRYSTILILTTFFINFLFYF